uniref:LapB rubredoxin metal binding domain-containing protein n=1 Tax=Magnetococcus massalia (strain MO-1) TaxID=451514 RepID=A0A1S7LKB7_MAGMO|nr:Conserved protein of unknown function; putative tetratricopeptide TPR_2 repeat protein [Candidatus Magnetococcus massalia]
MEINLLFQWAPWITIGLILFAIGYRLGQLSSGDDARETALQRDAAYTYRGLNFLLSDEPDKAIEAFTQAIRINSDTVEIYLSLANLFLQQGELGRAIRMHQNLLERPNLPREVRIAALYGLGEDYRKSGFVDRAVAAYHEVLEEDPGHIKALEALLNLHEQERRWDKALEVLEQVTKVSGRQDPRRAAHLSVQIGRDHLRHDVTPPAPGQAQQALNHAIEIHPGCVEARRLLAEKALEEGDPQQAVQLLRELRQTRPGHLFLLVDVLQKSYDALGDSDGFESCMDEAAHTQSASPQLILRWSRWLEERGRLDEAETLLSLSLERRPDSSSIARCYIALLLKMEAADKALKIAIDYLDGMIDQQPHFRCSHCGFESHEIYWKCPQCHHWDEMEPL